MWLVMIVTLWASGTIQQETSQWPDRVSCELYRTGVAYADPERPEGTGRLVGACRPSLPTGQISVRR